MSSNDELSASTSSSSDNESLESMREAEGSFNSIVHPYQDEPIADVQGEEIGEEEKDGEDGIRFAILESRFENKETVSNW